MSSDLHTHQMDQLDELHTLFAYRFQKWQHGETWGSELFETDVNDGDLESCREEPELPLPALNENAELSQELPWSATADKGRPQTPSSSTSSSSSLDTERNEPIFTVLDGRELNDIPAVYSVPTLQPYELAAVGVWIDKRIVPGFKYRVRAIESEKYEDDFLFGGNALRLQSIGCGYSRRITFAPGAGELNKNDNYFYSDSRRYGFAFQPELVSVGEKYTINDVSNHPLGHLEIIQMQYPQVEIKHTVLDDQSVEKMARVRSLAKVEWFDNNEVCVVSVTGNVISIKKKNSHAQVSRITGVTISGHPRRNYTLYPGVDDKQRCITVNGANCHDVPVSYSVVGLENYELPVIGTYVDPRVLPGFCYRVRPVNTKSHLFEGRALCLTNIGAGYSKRLTFAPDKNCLNANGNYFWTDSHPGGFGFELRAIHCGDAFRILVGDRCVGQASVFRVDHPQVEESQTVDKLAKGVKITKYVHVDLTCLVTIDLSDSEQSTSKICEDRVMRISGRALLQKASGDRRAKVLRIEDIGLDSQLNVLFFAEHKNVVFEAL